MLLLFTTTLTSALARADVEFVVLAEVQPMEQLRGWTSAGVNSYYCDFDTQVATDIVPGGLYRRLDEVRQNSAVLTSQANAALVESNLGSYFHDVSASRIYVSTVSGAHPDTAALVGAWFSLFFSTRAISFSDRPPYAPMITGALPALQSEMPDSLFGSMVSDSGEVSLLNGDGLFDRLSRQWVWRNKRVTFRLGGLGLDYSEFLRIDTMRINSIDVDDEVATLQLEDMGTILNRSLPLRTWGDGTISGSVGPTSPTEGTAGLSQPLVFGGVDWCPFALGGRSAGVADFWYAMEFNAGPYGTTIVDSVGALHRATQIGVTLTEGVDWTASGAIVTIINPTYFFEDYNICGRLLNVDTFIASEPCFGTMAMAILRLCGESSDNIDSAAFTAANIAAPQVLARWVGEPIQAADLMRSLETSVNGQVYRGSDGRWTCRLLDPSIPLELQALDDSDFSTWQPSGDLASVLNEVRIRYEHRPYFDNWREVSASDDTVRYGSETSDSHRVDSWMSDEADARELANHLRFLRSALTTTIEAEMRGLSLMTACVGDLVPVTRARAPVARTGRFDGHLLRIVKINKQLGPEAPSVTVWLNDLNGQTDRIARCLDAAEDVDWATATDQQRALYGFCADANGFIDAADQQTFEAKVAW